MTNARSQDLNKLKAYIKDNKKDCQSMTMKLRDLFEMYKGNPFPSIKKDIYDLYYKEKDFNQCSLSIRYNLLNNAPDHLIMYDNNFIFKECKGRKMSLLSSIRLFSQGFLLNLPTYPELDGYAWNKKIATNLGTNKYFDKDLRDSLLNKDIFVSIITRP